jgi:ATP-dependent DNA helicase RecG
MHKSFKSNFIDDAIKTIEISVSTGIFTDVEKSKIELKDLSSGAEWTSLKETICAYLNTDGGIVICGVREREKQYSITGFNRNNESKVIDLQSKEFKNDLSINIDLSTYIYFEYFPITIGALKELLVIVVYPLSDDLKYLSYNGKYYERKLTQDKEIPIQKIQRQKEYKQELEFAKEISIVEGAKINNLSLDKINRYINLLNLEIRNETLKANLTKAKPFLTNQHFIKQEEITTLGMLVCAEDPFHFLASRVEVNCFYDTSSDIGKDKKIFRNDVINLMEDTFRYIWGNIKINRSVREGGRSEPEYPEKMIRETINNALAHRDYNINNFVTVTVEPNRYIEIKNPGSFKEKIKIIHTDTEIQVRRLIPGIPESKNPKLASVLKIFDKIESQGRGMASLVNEALDNNIDLPYYELKDGMISLRIPTGKLVDDAIEIWLNGFEAYMVKKIKAQLTFEHKSVLAYFYKSEMLNRRRYFTILLSENNNHFIVLEQLKNAGLIYEHSVSTEEAPVYILDRVLLKTEFTDEMIMLLGDDFINFDPVAKEVLNICYLFSKYNKQALKAADISPEVYRRLHGKEVIAKAYESLGRKVRNICNQFKKLGVLSKDIKNAYTFVMDYKKPEQLF